MQFPSALVGLFGALAVVSAEGINCNGNSNCASQGDNALTEVHDKLLGMDQNQQWGNGAHIACAGGTSQACAFYQNIEGTKSTGEAAQHVGNLLSHGCKVCGSDPTEPGNNVATGELTVNWVSNP